MIFRFVPKLLFTSFLALSVCSQALATYTVTGNATLTDNATFSNNTGSGIEAQTAGTYTLGVSGTININNNTLQGINTGNNVNLTFNGVTGNDKININGSGERGIYIPNTTSSIVFNNLDLIISGAGSIHDTTYGVCSHGFFKFQGNGSNLFEITGSNVVSGLHIYGQSGYSSPSATISDTNVNISNNTQYGILMDYEASANATGTINISSSSGSNTLRVNNNKLDGILGKNGSQLTISDMNVEVTGNGSGSASSGGDVMLQDGGIEMFGKITITGDGHLLNVSNNNAYGIAAKADTRPGIDSDLLIRDMNVTASGNGGIGLYVEGISGVIESTDGVKTLNTSNNGMDGLNFQGDMTIKNMNVITNSNGGTATGYDGIENVKNLNIIGNGQTVLQAKSNGGAGITSYTSDANLTIQDMNIELSDNNNVGLNVGNSSATISSTNGNNYMLVSGNAGDGISVNGTNPSLTIANMDVQIENNNGIGLNARGATLNISSASGDNKMIFNNNEDLSFYSLNSNTTIDKMNIYISNTKAVAVDSSPIGMCAHGNFQMTGDGSTELSIDTSTRGLHLANSDTGSHAQTIKDYNISLTNNTLYGLWVNGSTGTISSTNKNNTMYFDGNGKSIYLQSSNATNATNTVLTLDGMQVATTDSLFVDMDGSENAASMTMKNGSLYLDGTNQQVFSMGTNSTLTLNNVQQSGAIPATLINNTGTSNTAQITTNSLVFGKVTDTGRLNLQLSDNSRWNMLNSSNTYALMNTNSSIDLRNSAANTYNTLTVNNSYTGNNGLMYLNTNLDALNETDQLVLSTGALATGTTNLFITDTSDASSYGTFIKGDGIKVVNAQGSATTGAGTFDLVGKKIDTGLYIQELYYQNIGMTDQSWYLRTATEDDGGGNKGSDGSYSNGDKPKATDLTKTIVAVPSMGLSVVKAINSELRTRLGELRSNDPRRLNGLWVRGYAKSLDVSEGIKSEMDIRGVEAGYDYMIGRSAQHRTYLGLMAGYATSDNSKIKQHNGYRGKGDVTVPSVGAYVTWIKRNGWFVDGVMRAFFTKMDITNRSAQGQYINYDAKRMYYTGSLEVGKRLPMYQSGRNGFILEPKAQILYTYAPAKDFKTSLGQKIRFDDTHSLVTRAALQAAYRRTFANNMILEPFIQGGIAYEWMGKTDVRFIGTDFESDPSGAVFEGVLGLNARLTKMWHIYADLMIERGSSYKSFGGHLGTRLNF